MECVIKIMKGADAGQEFRCSGAENVVGRSPRSQIRLSSPAVSYEHAVITRNGDDFLLENLSAAGTFVNDERITGKVRLRAKDELRFGPETVARVEAVPTGGSESSRRRLLVVGLGAMLAVLVLVVLADPFAKKPAPLDYQAAYVKLQAFAEREAAEKKLPEQTVGLLREAWRLEMSKDRAASIKLWLQLNLLLAGFDRMEKTAGLQRASDEDPHALAEVAAAENDAALTENQLKAALVQFVNRMSGMKDTASMVNLVDKSQ